MKEAARLRRMIFELVPILAKCWSKVHIIINVRRLQLPLQKIYGSFLYNSILSKIISFLSNSVPSWHRFYALFMILLQLTTLDIYSLNEFTSKLLSASYGNQHFNFRGNERNTEIEMKFCPIDQIVGNFPNTFTAPKNVLIIHVAIVVQRLTRQLLGRIKCELYLYTLLWHRDRASFYCIPCETVSLILLISNGTIPQFICIWEPSISAPKQIFYKWVVTAFSTIMWEEKNMNEQDWKVWNYNKMHVWNYNKMHVEKESCSCYSTRVHT